MILVALFALAAAQLYDQSMARLLRERFSDPRVSYLFGDAQTGRLIDARWDDSARPTPLGSLVKPFTALAYGETHRFRYPEVVCRGKKDGCWNPRGHGRIGVTEAVAHSCNVYFHTLAAGLDWSSAAGVARRFGLETPPPNSPGAFVGLDDRWRVSPEAMLSAYCRLAGDPQAKELLRGMALSASVGTGKGAGGGLVKTGTAPCTHARRAPGDGFVIALYPATAPRYALLLRLHGAPGAEAAAVLGRMLRLINEGH